MGLLKQFGDPFQGHLASSTDAEWTVDNLPRPPPRRHDQHNGANILKVLSSMTLTQWAFFWIGWLAWLCDAVDFFAVSLAVVRLSTTFGKEASQITQSITLTLLFRPLGAAIFGMMGDSSLGRKWPLVLDLVLCAALSLATGFVKDFQSFLAVRSLFGICMGGIWGLANSTGQENAPVAARGFLSGIYQQGYAVGYLVASVVNLTAVPQYNTWRVLFYVASIITIIAAAIRAVMPESPVFAARLRAGQVDTRPAGEKVKTFVRSAGQAIRTNWIRCIYAVLLMTGFNFYSHGSQDLYPTYLQKSKGFSSHTATVGNIIGNCGAITGGTIAGYVSQFLGRRLTIIVCCVWTACFLPLWLIPKSFGPLAAGAFFVQMGVQGAWGVIPVYLIEISPPAFRSTWPGVAYQLGNMISSASSQIEAKAGESLRLNATTPDYGLVSVILIAVVSGYIILLMLVGHEDHGTHFEESKAAFEENAGREKASHLLDPSDAHRSSESFPSEGKPSQEKVETTMREEAETPRTHGRVENV